MTTSDTKKKQSIPFKVGDRVVVHYTGGSSHWPNTRKIDFVRDYASKGKIVDATEQGFGYLVELDAPSPWNGATLMCAVPFMLRRLKKRERRKWRLKHTHMGHFELLIGNLPGRDETVDVVEVKRG